MVWNTVNNGKLGENVNEYCVGHIWDKIIVKTKKNIYNGTEGVYISSIYLQRQKK